MATVGRVGRCATCAAFTYDAHELSEEELRRLVLETEGRVLTTLVRRLDGRVMSVDCGHGTVRPASRRWGLMQRALLPLLVAAVFAFVLHGVFGPAPRDEGVVTPTPVPSAPIIERPPAVVPVPSRLLLVKTPEPQAPSPPRVTASDAVRVDVHLSEVIHTWSGVRNGEVVDVLEPQLEPVRQCYERTLSRAPGYRGVLSIRLNVERGGQISHVSTPRGNNQALDDGLSRCVEASLKGFEFPEGFSWQSGVVSFKLVFAGVL